MVRPVLVRTVPGSDDVPVSSLPGSHERRNFVPGKQTMQAIAVQDAGARETLNWYWLMTKRRLLVRRKMEKKNKANLLSFFVLRLEETVSRRTCDFFSLFSFGLHHKHKFALFFFSMVLVD